MTPATLTVRPNPFLFPLCQSVNPAALWMLPWGMNISWGKLVALQPKSQNRCNPPSRLLALTNFLPPKLPWDLGLGCLPMGVGPTWPCCRQDMGFCRQGDIPSPSGSCFQLAPRGIATWIRRMRKPTTRNHRWRSGSSPPAPTASARCSSPSCSTQNALALQPVRLC